MYANKYNGLCLLMAVSLLAIAVYADENGGFQKDSVICLDENLGMLPNLTMETRSQIAPRVNKKRSIGTRPCAYVEDLLKRYKPLVANINEGVVFYPKAAGKYYPLFPFERFRINANAGIGDRNFIEDPWDEILAHIGPYVFDDIDLRRHAHDSVKMKNPEFHGFVINK